mmetsp:Transcript_12932/g.28704  ORF Transcript_12932/g.28704 Transcript_12932/m.28704 type:complete len:296 (+) Transcript_12932:445-1332(+)
MVASLTRSRHLELDSGRMPRANARNLSEATVGLAHQSGHTPAGHDALEALALGGTEHVNHLVLGEDALQLHLLLEEAHDEVHLVSGAAAVDLDLLDVGLLLADLGLSDLGVADGADGLAVLLGTLDLRLHGGALLVGGLPALLVPREGLLLGAVPVLVEAALHLVVQVASPDRGQGTRATRGLDVAHEANHHHGRGLQDGDGLGDLLLVQLGTRPVHLAHDVGHAGLEGHEGRQVGFLGGVILREGLDLAVVVLGALPGQEAQGAVSGTFELTMRHVAERGATADDAAVALRSQT